MTHFNQDTLNQALSTGAVVLADFWAEWCIHCKPLAPVMEELAQRYEGRAEIGKINVDEERELAIHYRVMGIPTVILFQNGQEAERWTGAMPLETYAQALDRALEG